MHIRLLLLCTLLCTVRNACILDTYVVLCMTIRFIRILVLDSLEY
jgi:hypothetical protein